MYAQYFLHLVFLNTFQKWDRQGIYVSGLGIC